MGDDASSISQPNQHGNAAANDDRDLFGDLTFGGDHASNNTSGEQSNQSSSRTSGAGQQSKQYYIRLLLLGKKPERFLESTTIPTFLEWGSPVICRVPKYIVTRAIAGVTKKHSLQDRICQYYSEAIVAALSSDPGIKCSFVEHAPTDAELEANNETKTFAVITMVHLAASSSFSGGGTVVAASSTMSLSAGGDLTMAAGSKRFFFRSKVATTPRNNLMTSPSSHGGGRAKATWTMGFVETMVARRFPCALSRQRSIITSEYVSGAAEGNLENLYQC